MKALPSIRNRLAHALLGWSLLFSLAIALAVWLAARHEADELLDDSLRASAEVLSSVLRPLAEVPVPQQLGMPLAAIESNGGHRFAWQLVDTDARVLLRSAGAPELAWRVTPDKGFSDLPGWHVHATPLGAGNRMLYVAQSREERDEAAMEVTMSTVLAALAVALLGHVWLRAKVNHELAPLQELSRRLASHDPLQPGASLGRAARQELQPMHEAIDALGRRLAHRLSSERAFSAHAAHALRTPLAGIDVQLAVALREAPAALQPRLQRVRDAAQRLQRVVVALLALFRSGDAEPKLQTLELSALFARLPVEGLRIELPAAGASLRADPDLLAAALLNLLDNAQRHGAQCLQVSLPAPQTLRLHDDGTEVAAEQRQRLLAGLRAGRESQPAQAAPLTADQESGLGLGLLLADLVARSHGGALDLPAVDKGFTVDLRLAPD